MSGSITPGPTAGGRRRGGCTRFWLLMTIGCIWMIGPGDRPPGTGRLSYKLVDCRECLRLKITMPNGSKVQARKMKNGWCQCRNGHRYRA
jgi:hypothetical protein